MTLYRYMTLWPGSNSFSRPLPLASYDRRSGGESGLGGFGELGGGGSSHEEHARLQAEIVEQLTRIASSLDSA
jgi:hypothetical protein